MGVHLLGVDDLPFVQALRRRGILDDRLVDALDRVEQPAQPLEVGECAGGERERLLARTIETLIQARGDAADDEGLW